MAAEKGQQGDEEKQKKPGRGFTATTIYAAFGFMTALISFVFLVNPAWRPDPRERQIADLTAAAMDVGITFGAYERRIGRSHDVDDPDTTCVPGSVVYVKESLQGFKRRETTLRWLTMEAKTHARARSSTPPGGGGVRLRGEAASDQGVSLVWVEWPYQPVGASKYFIRFELFSGNKLLAIADTPEFQVAATDYNTRYVKCAQDVDAGTPLEGPGFAEASSGGGGGFDVGRWLLYAALAVTVGLLAAFAFHGATGLLRRRRQE